MDSRCLERIYFGKRNRVCIFKYCQCRFELAVNNRAVSFCIRRVRSLGFVESSWLLSHRSFEWCSRLFLFDWPRQLCRQIINTASNTSDCWASQTNRFFPPRVKWCAPTKPETVVCLWLTESILFAGSFDYICHARHERPTTHTPTCLFKIGWVQSVRPAWKKETEVHIGTFMGV